MSKGKPVGVGSWRGGPRFPLFRDFSFPVLPFSPSLPALIFGVLVASVAKSIGRESMVMQTNEKGAQLGRLRPMCEMGGDLLNDLVLRESLSIDKRNLNIFLPATAFRPIRSGQ